MAVKAGRSVPAAQYPREERQRQPLAPALDPVTADVPIALPVPHHRRAPGHVQHPAIGAYVLKHAGYGPLDVFGVQGVAVLRHGSLRQNFNAGSSSERLPCMSMNRGYR